jgi:hypothetical protein
MSISGERKNEAPVEATGLLIGEDDFTVCLRDGRRIAVPYGCYPRLDRATARERAHFEVYAGGRMLCWPEIDEDIEVRHIVEGRMPVKAATGALTVAEGRAPYRAGRAGQEPRPPRRQG